MANWLEITNLALQQNLESIITFIPTLLSAIIVFGVGWLIAAAVGKLIAGILNSLNFNKFLERAGWTEAFTKAELKLDGSAFIGAIAKWSVVIIFLIAATDILQWNQFGIFLREVTLFLIPNVIAAAFIFIVAVIIADILEKLIKASVKRMGVGYAEFLGAAIRWTILSFAILMILAQLQVTPVIIETLVQGIVGMFALAFGIAFGLGGKDAAARLIEDARKKLSEK